MTEAKTIRWLRDLGYDSIHFARELKVRGEVVRDRWWTCQVLNVRQFAGEDDGRRRKGRSRSKYPSIATQGGPTRKAALQALVAFLVREKVDVYA